MLMSEKKYSDENYKRFIKFCNDLKEIYELGKEAAKENYSKGYYAGGLRVLLRIANQLKNFPIKGGDK